MSYPLPLKEEADDDDDGEEGEDEDDLTGLFTGL
jgi:hypothetical protein